ncbi:MAG: hypothetical protein NTY07_18020 [Bacteroidia bacterium]|nr:hypothetical protein [Bacteroidia bacterium]
MEISGSFSASRFRRATFEWCGNHQTQGILLSDIPENAQPIARGFREAEAESVINRYTLVKG